MTKRAYSETGGYVHKHVKATKLKADGTLEIFCEICRLPINKWRHPFPKGVGW